MQKDKKFNMHITEEDWNKIKILREKYDINMSHFFRESMRKLYKYTIKKHNDQYK
jgi:hypothetical protein